MPVILMDILIPTSLLQEQIQSHYGSQPQVSQRKNGYFEQVVPKRKPQLILILAKKVALETNSTVLLANVLTFFIVQADNRHGIIVQTR